MRKVLLLVAPVCYKTVAEDMIECANKGIGMMLPFNGLYSKDVWFLIEEQD